MTMSDGNGYWVNMTTADMLYVNGTIIAPGSAPASYQLSAGWNLVGFTQCFNPGSEYVSGVLCGLVINLSEKKIDNYVFTEG